MSSNRCSLTGCARPGIDTTGQPKKYVEKASAFKVADMSINFKFFLRSNKSFKMIRRKSVFKSLSWTYVVAETWEQAHYVTAKLIAQRTSSTNMCDTEARSGSHCSRRNKTPVVQRSSLVLEEIFFSNLMEYPHVSPTFSVLSSAIRSDTPIALIRLGCVTIMLVMAPCPFNILSSSTSCGTWVVFPGAQN